MGLLEDNLKLGLEAVKYAKENVARSGNQTYFKTLSPFKQKARNNFLLGATRGGNYLPTFDEGGNHSGYVKDEKITKRRNKVEALIADPDFNRKEKEKKLDEWIKAWGKDYFFDRGEQTVSVGPNGRTQFSYKSDDQQIKKLAKAFGKSDNQMRSELVGKDTAYLNQLYELFKTKYEADQAKKFGVGNCYEKGELAALYLMDHSPGGVRLTLYALDSEHKGLTGIVTGAGGDHVFAVYGHDTVATNVGSLGPNAIIVDGWMNDAYPAQKHLTMKHGNNYNNVRINIKQFTTRNMVCVSYRSHINAIRDFGILSPGRHLIPQTDVTRKHY